MTNIYKDQRRIFLVRACFERTATRTIEIFIFRLHTRTELLKPTSVIIYTDRYDSRSLFLKILKSSDRLLPRRIRESCTAIKRRKGPERNRAGATPKRKGKELRRATNQRKCFRFLRNRRGSGVPYERARSINPSVLINGLAIR